MTHDEDIWPIYEEIIVLPSTNSLTEIKKFLDEISLFVKQYSCHPEASDNASSLIFRAKDLFTQCVGFVILSTLCGKNPYLKKKFKASLSRGFRSFYGINILIDEKTILPKEIPPASLEPFLERVPELARVYPIAYLAFVFIQCFQETLLWEDEKTPAQFLKMLFEQKISGISHSGVLLTRLLHWNLPEWIDSQECFT